MNTEFTYFFSCGTQDQFGGTPTVKGLYQEDPPGYPEFQEYILEESTNDDLSNYYKDKVVALTLDYEDGTNKTKPVLWYSSQVIISKIYSSNNFGTVNSPLTKTMFKVNRRDARATTYVPFIEKPTTGLVLPINYSV